MITVLETVKMSLYFIILLSLVLNINQVFTESKALKEQGKTPLVGKNLTTVILAAVAELVLVAGVVFLIEPVFTPTGWQVGLLFASLYLLKDVAAYLTGWGTWAVYVNLEKRKMKKQIEEDQEEAM